jgi:uncharacterized protein (TIGR02099 family)
MPGTQAKLEPKRLLRRVSKVLFATLGGIAILLAVALGVFRLLVAQIPEYQTEIKQRVAAELGLVVDFKSLDARLGLRGPELTLREATIGSGTEFLQADRAAITLDPTALLVGRRIDVSHLTLDGVKLTVERDPQGTFRLGDFALASGSGGLAATIPESVRVAIRNSELLYIDAARDREWLFTDLELSIESTDGDYVASASLMPPDALAGRLSLDFRTESPVTDGQSIRWRLDADTDELDLGVLAALLPIDPVLPVSGHGAVDAVVEWSDNRLAGLRVGVDLADLGVGEAGNEPYEYVQFVADWQRSDAAGWQLALDRIEISRNGRAWDPAGSAGFSLATVDGEVQAITLVSDFFRLEDLKPVFSAFPETQIAEQWELFEPAGDVRNLDFAIQRRNSSFAYELETRFERFAVRQLGTTPGIAGMSGRVSATEDSGTIEFQSGEFSVEWPSLFRETLSAESLTGAVIWRQGLGVVQVTSVDLDVGLLGREARASFDLRLPRDGSAPSIDIAAQLASVDLVAAKRYLPTGILPAALVNWLDRAVTGGQARNIELSLAGNLEAFPFDNGGGQFRVAAELDQASLDYMREWPVAEQIDGRIEFVNAGFLAEVSGSTLGNRTENLVVSIPDLRNPVMTLRADTEGRLASVVDYLRSAPLITERLGPGFDRIEVFGGAGAIHAELDLPFMDLANFNLDAALNIIDGSLTVRGLRPSLTEVNGTVIAEEDSVFATALGGVFLGGSIGLSLMPSDRAGYRAELAVEGETAANALAESFGLPQSDLIDGQTLWRGRLMLPALDPLATTPTRITVDSNLAGVAFRFPEPLAKAPSEPLNLSVNLQFAAGNRLEVTGNLGATRRFELGFAIDDDRLEFTRGAVAFGGDEPRLPVQAGILVGGQIETLELDRWLALGRNTGVGRAAPLFLGADLKVASLHGFGQQLGTTALRVERGRNDWLVQVDSEAIAGQISVPRGGDRREPIVADMSRLYLATSGGSGFGASAAPQTMPGLRIQAQEFGFGNRELGRVAAVVEPVARGLMLTEFTSQTPNLQMDITGSWLSRPLGSRTTIAAEIRSTDVQAALADLGLDPVIEGESATVTASVRWDSAPTAAWLDHLNGEVSLFVETGTLREIDPGAGRVVGLMSIAALPRRLLLDFRDVFEQGFAFDEISGTFRIIDGNAYTNDLKFGGPAAEIGVVGRTGLRDRDYRQQIVITAEPSNMLPTVGGLLGGAGVGAALLIFTRLFKEPLKGIGRASYCLSGSWEEPIVEPIDNDEPEAALRCAELPEAMRPAEIDD